MGWSYTWSPPSEPPAPDAASKAFIAEDLERWQARWTNRRIGGQSPDPVRRTAQRTEPSLLERLQRRAS